MGRNAHFNAGARPLATLMSRLSTAVPILVPQHTAQVLDSEKRGVSMGASTAGVPRRGSGEGPSYVSRRACTPPLVHGDPLRLTSGTGPSTGPEFAISRRVNELHPPPSRWRRGALCAVVAACIARPRRLDNAPAHGVVPRPGSEGSGSVADPPSRHNHREWSAWSAPAGRHARLDHGSCHRWAQLH